MTSWLLPPFPQSFSGAGDYQETPEDTVVRNRTDSGITKARRRQTRAEATVMGSFDLSLTEVEQFMDFFNYTLAGGSLVFTGSLTRTQTVQTYRFSENPTIVHLGGDMYRLSAKLFVIPS